MDLNIIGLVCQEYLPVIIAGSNCQEYFRGIFARNICLEYLLEIFVKKAQTADRPEYNWSGMPVIFVKTGRTDLNIIGSACWEYLPRIFAGNICRE